MSELTITQDWLFHKGFKDQPLTSKVSVVCSDGNAAEFTFAGPERESFTMEVTDESSCNLAHQNKSSAFETESSCGSYIEVTSDTECIYLSVGFNESVPTLAPTGIAVMVGLLLGIAMLKARKGWS